MAQTTMDVEPNSSLEMVFHPNAAANVIDTGRISGVCTVCHSLHPNIIGSGESPDAGAKAMLDLITKLAQALTRLQAETQGGQ